MPSRVINGSDNIGAIVQLRNYGFSIGREKIYSSQVQSADIITEENLIRSEGGGKSVIGALGWGTAGGIFFGPLGGLAGLIFGGRRTPKITSEKNICFGLYLKDGRRYLITSDSYTFQAIKGMAFVQVQPIPLPVTPKAINSYDNEKINIVPVQTQKYLPTQLITQKKTGLSKGLIALIVIVALFVLSGLSTLINSLTDKTTSPKNIAATTVEESGNENPTNDSVIIEDGTIFNISIANGSGVAGLAKKTAKLFETIKYPSGINKYNITHITNTDKYDYEHTEIICKLNDNLLIQAAEDIKVILEAGIITTSNEVSEDTDIAIIIGKDYSLPDDEEITEDDKKDTNEIKYEIIHTLNLRLDDTVAYYVLIDPIDLSDDSFKEDIKGVIRKIVEEKGRKIDIVIFDNRNSLENGYKDDEYSVEGGLEKFEEWKNWYTDEIINDLAIHCIATFSGEDEYDFYLNTLYFFIYSDSVDSGNVETGKYAEIIEFNPNTE